jgi:biotin carboxyl carrier protein
MNITTEVAGTVFSIEVAVGQSVKTDDVLAYIESMKMEIPITALAAGVVTSIAVVTGETVKENQTLIVLG